MLLASCELVDVSQTRAAIGLKEPMHAHNAFPLNQVIFKFYSIQTTGIGVNYHPSRCGELNEHSGVIFVLSCKDAEDGSIVLLSTK